MLLRDFGRESMAGGWRFPARDHYRRRKESWEVRTQMKGSRLGMFVAVAVISLIVGGIAGFFLGVTSTETGRRFLEDLVEQE